MNKSTWEKQHYIVTLSEPEKAGGALVFTFVPNGPHERNGAGIPKRKPQFVVGACQGASGPTFDWSETPDDPGTARDEIEAEIAVRMKDRSVWIDRVTALIAQVEQWAKELDWSTRRIEKVLEDESIGNHRVPALLMQEETCRILLEPIGRSAPGIEGVVDLYLMPAYDDIATLYYYNDRWNLHYIFTEGKTATSVREAEPMPLGKETFAKVLAELRQHAV